MDRYIGDKKAKGYCEIKKKFPATPLFIIEEHHEAFFIWNYAIHKGLMPGSGNVLLHVDQHADLQPSRFNRSVKSLAGDLPALCKFTYNELAIHIFIPAALYLGIFGKLFWLQHNKLKVTDPQPLHVYSYKQAGQTLMMTDNIYEAGPFNPDRQSVVYQIKTIAGQLSASEPLVLDIDLDYFSCAKEHFWQNLGSGRVEITAAEYERIATDKYHLLRSIASGVRVQQENGRYYLLVNTFPEVITSTLKVSPARIRKRVETLVRFLKVNHIRPLLIDVCRSRFSGFTAEDQWEFIQRELLEKLNDLYDYDICHIDDILSKEKLNI